MIRGAFQLKGLRGPVELYTRKAHADYIIDNDTKEEYAKGDWVAFRNLPELVEDTGHYSFISTVKAQPLSTEGIVREAAIKSLFN